jgi:hypothetical protein
MTRPGSVHISGCTCGTCSNGVIQVVVPGTGGVQGIQGVQGRTGVQGARGLQGTTGNQGTTGTQGTTGSGTQGVQGRQGTTGAGTQGTTGTQGIQGIQGGGVTLQQVEDAIAGAALSTTDDLTEGTTNKYFTVSKVSYDHIQGVASNSWVINHNLGFKPNVTVVDSAGTIYEGEIAYTNTNSLTVSFSAAFSGRAYLS